MSEKNFYDDLLRHQLTQLSKQVPELDLAFQGNQLLLNVSVAYSRQVVAKQVICDQRLAEAEATIETLTADVAVLRVANERQEEQIAELRNEVKRNSERIENMAQWAKTKGKT